MPAQAETEEWLSLKEVAATLKLSQTKVHELTEEVDPVTSKPFLEAWRPAERTLWISAASVQRHKLATRDIEFWSIRRRLREATPAERTKILKSLSGLYSPPR